jgi:hypothetical protein
MNNKAIKKIMEMKYNLKKKKSEQGHPAPHPARHIPCFHIPSVFTYLTSCHSHHALVI